MRMTVKRIETEKTSIVNMIHTILNLTSKGDCVTCTSVVEYLTREGNSYTYAAEISTVLKILAEMGYFTAEYGNVERYNSTIKIYTRTGKLNDIF